MKRSVFNISGKGMALVSIALLSFPGLFAQTQSGGNGMFVVYTLLTFVVLVLVLVIAITFYVMKVINMLVDKSAREQAERAGKVYVPAPSLWKTVTHKLTRSTPVEKEADILMEHSYDGIRELDNHLPPWWTWLFYGTAAWAVVYMIVYHVIGALPLSTDEYLAEVKAIQQLRATQEIVQIDEEALEYTAETAFIEKGKEIFVNNCASCHRNDGGGGIGPNLTDEYWLHGAKVKDVFAVIKNGVPEKGMISWAAILKPEEVRDAAFFIMSIRGSNPAGAKEPQGEVFTE